MAIIEDLLDLQIPGAVKLSPNGQQVVYTTTFEFGHQTGEHAVSTIWLAETGKAGSSREMTSGQSNDGSPRWSPDGQSIAFTSDRSKRSESCAIYLLPLSGGEARPLTPAANERGISRFEFSPDGKRIAFLAADEKTEAEKTKEKEKDDANVWGENLTFDRLHVVELSTKEVTTIVRKDAHLIDLAWSTDSQSIVYRESESTDLEFRYLKGTTMYSVDVATKESTKVCHFGSFCSDLTVTGDLLHFLGSATVPGNIASSVVYEVKLSTIPADFKKVGYGEENCALGITSASKDTIVHVQHGMEDQLRILNGHTLFAKKKKISAWDAAFTRDSDEIVLAIAQGDVNSPEEVYSTTASGGAMVRLSNHGAIFKDRKFGTCTFLSCPSSDKEVQLECPWITPASAATNADGSPKEPLPTVVLVHGGPYYRHTDSFDSYYFMWGPILLDAGYAILNVEYRGSSGRGNKFAAYGSGVGKYDYEDVITLTQHAVEKGYADKERLAIAGWSQGGFMSFLASVRNGQHGHGWQFKAAVPGAGVSDGDTLCFTSDIGAVEAEMGAGKPPWALEKNDTRGRLGSALWEFGDAMRAKVPIPPILILHGEKDARVPLEQAVGMRRALIDHKLPFEYVSYPREAHIFKERKHIVDLGERLVKFLGKHMGGK